PLITSDKKHYLIRLPSNADKTNKLRQISGISIASEIQKFITDENNDVTQVLAYSRLNDTVFYEATHASARPQKHIFRKSRIFAAEAEPAVCLTCNQMDRNCTYQTAIFSPNAQHFMLICLGMVLKLGSEKKLQNLLQFRAFPQFRTFQVPIGDYSKC
ncbi:unnamed protein product, partial [Oppiella nova]